MDESKSSTSILYWNFRVIFIISLQSEPNWNIENVEIGNLILRTFNFEQMVLYTYNITIIHVLLISEWNCLEQTFCAKCA